MQENLWGILSTTAMPWIQAPLKYASLEMNADIIMVFTLEKFNSTWYCYPQPEDLPDLCTCGKCAHKNGYVRCAHEIKRM